MIFIILPAFNEAKALQALIPAIGQELAAQPYKIVLVDDGSSDATPQVAAELSKKQPIEVLRHQPNQGYGAAIRTGALWVIKNGKPEDVALTLDADNTHLPTFFPVLTRKLGEGFDVVTASVSLPGGRLEGVPPLRRLMSAVVNRLFGSVCAIPGISTYTNGFRAFRVRALQRAHAKYGDRLMEDTGFPGGVELFLKVIKAGGRPAEAPFTLYYQNRGGDSKIRFIQTIRRYLLLLSRFRQF